MPMALYTDSRHCLSSIITAGSQAQLCGPHLSCRGYTWLRLPAQRPLPWLPPLPKADVNVGQRAGPSLSPSPHWETPPSNIQWLKERKACPTTSISHFALGIKRSSSVKRLLGERKGRAGARPWPLSQGPAGRQVRRNRAEVIKDRTRDICTPLGHASPIPTPLGYWQNGCKQVIIRLKIYFSQLESWKVSV